MASSYISIIKDIKKGNIKPIYFLHGEESFFIDKIANEIEALIPEESKDFNLSILYGKDVEAKDIMDDCRQFPMMSDRRVVSVREAQNVGDIQALEIYLDHTVPSTVLVIGYKNKKIDGRTSFAKKIKKSALVFESKMLYENQIESWISAQLNDHGIIYDLSVPTLLAQHLGRDLSKIEGEIDKVKTNLLKGEKLTPTMVEKWVGINRDYNVFELQNAMSRGQMKKVMTIVNYFSNNVKSHAPVMVLASLYGYFYKLMMMGVHRKADQKTLLAKTRIGNPFFLKEYRKALNFWKGRKVIRAFELLSEYDLKLKGVNNSNRIPPGELLKEMIFRMMTEG